MYLLSMRAILCVEAYQVLALAAVHADVIELSHENRRAILALTASRAERKFRDVPVKLYKTNMSTDAVIVHSASASEARRVLDLEVALAAEKTKSQSLSMEVARLRGVVAELVRFPSPPLLCLRSLCLYCCTCAHVATSLWVWCCVITSGIHC